MFRLDSIIIVVFLAFAISICINPSSTRLEYKISSTGRTIAWLLSINDTQRFNLIPLIIWGMTTNRDHYVVSHRLHYKFRVEPIRRFVSFRQPDTNYYSATITEISDDHALSFLIISLPALESIKSTLTTNSLLRIPCHGPLGSRLWRRCVVVGWAESRFHTDLVPN